MHTARQTHCVYLAGTYLPTACIASRRIEYTAYMHMHMSQVAKSLQLEGGYRLVINNGEYASALNPPPRGICV